MTEGANENGITGKISGGTFHKPQDGLVRGPDGLYFVKYEVGDAIPSIDDLRTDQYPIVNFYLLMKNPENFGVDVLPGVEFDSIDWLDERIIGYRVEGVSSDKMSLENVGAVAVNLNEASGRVDLGKVSEGSVKAHEILEAGVKHMKDRAETYDKDGDYEKGERSIPATVRAFEAITGDTRIDSDEKGWLFQVLLKLVRSQQGAFKLDNYEDAAAYVGLMGEAAAEERGE